MFQWKNMARYLLWLIKLLLAGHFFQFSRCWKLSWTFNFRGQQCRWLQLQNSTYGLRDVLVLCHVQRYKNSQGTALTSTNPQIQNKVFVHTAALELACQQWSIKKQGIMGFMFFMFLHEHTGRCRTWTSQSGRTAGVHPSGGRMMDLSRYRETERGEMWPAGSDKAKTVFISLSRILHSESSIVSAQDKRFAVRVPQFWTSLLENLRLTESRTSFK